MCPPKLISGTPAMIGFVIRFGIAFAIITTHPHVPLALTAEDQTLEQIRHLLPDLLVVLYCMGALFLKRKDLFL